MSLTGNILYALQAVKDNWLYILGGAALANPRYGLKLGEIAARISIYWIGQQFKDGASYGKIAHEVLTRKPGAKVPPLISAGDKAAVGAAGRSLVTRGGAKLAPLAGPVKDVAKFLVATPARTYLTIGTAAMVAGAAVGSTRSVQTAPAEKGSPGMMMGVW